MKVFELMSPTCVPCKMLRAKLEAMKSDKLEVYSVDLTADFPQGLPENIRVRASEIRSTPHLIVLNDGGEVILDEHGTFGSLEKIKNSFTK